MTKYIMIFLCVFFVSDVTGDDEFIVSYKALVKNQILFGEQYDISKALTQSLDYRIIGVCDFIDKSGTQSDESDTKSTYIAIKNNKDSMLECLHKYVDINLRDDTKFIDNAIDSSTRLYIPPQRILADFDNGVVNIILIEKIR